MEIVELGHVMHSLSLWARNGETGPRAAGQKI
jgi:hypothetical protein